MHKPRSFFYKNSQLCQLILKAIHGNNFEARYRYMAKQIGKNKSVLEPGAGPGIIVPFLDPTTTYYGFDLNIHFVTDAHNRGINISYGNILDENMYKISDVAVLIDVLHHLRPENQIRLLKNTLKATKTMIIICEPYEHGSPLLKKIPGVNFLQKKFFDYIEQDGNNEARSEHVHSLSVLREIMENGFGVMPTQTKREIQMLGPDLITTYYLGKNH